MNKPESLINTKKGLLSEETMKMFIIISMMEKTKEPIPEEAIGTFLYQVLAKRLAYFKIPVNSHAICLIASMIDSPGKAVMWAYTLNEIYRIVAKEITIEDIVEHGFGDGFPIESEYKRIWDAQKIKAKFPDSDNALDYPEHWQ